MPRSLAVPTSAEGVAPRTVPPRVQRPRWLMEPAWSLSLGALGYVAAVALSLWFSDTSDTASKLKLIAALLTPIYVYPVYKIVREVLALAAKVRDYTHLYDMALAYSRRTPLFDFGGAATLYAAAQEYEQLEVDLTLQASRLQLDFSLLACLAGAFNSATPEDRRALTIQQSLYEFIGTAAQLCGPQTRGGCILLADLADHRLRIAAESGLNPAEIDVVNKDLFLDGTPPTSAAAAAYAKRDIVVVNIDEHGKADSPYHRQMGGNPATNPVRSYACVALPPAGSSTPIGVLCLDSEQPHTFDDDSTRALLITLATNVHLVILALQRGNAPKWCAERVP